MSNNIIKELVSDILDLDDIMFSVNSGSGICEVKSEKGLPVRINDKWMTIGDEDKLWHIHLNLENISMAKFVKEGRQSGKNGYSIRFFDTTGTIAMRTNFVKMYDDAGKLIVEKSKRYEELFAKYGKREVVSFDK